MDTTPDEINSNVVQLFPSKLTDIEDTKKAARDLAKAVCIGNFNKRLFCEEIRKQHPGVQAEICKLILKLLEQWNMDGEVR
mgnify:CR=1 FL=1|tara:strand:+ start:235 stop:477 length:243 start_codon:yes stop_codon:yes gene_type:complete